ncbi:FAD/NAD(P)-binding domain-containing protein [Neurospora tetrasperma FGSC 2509]|nr:FAD/NAD(P)-binding domain-containing protein [Neurospora tetrasperma FGSC 2509]
MTTSQPSGLHILIVGAGFAGLSAAIECTRKGHRVTLFEKVSSIDEITRYGDIISFDPNGSRAFEKWVFPDTSSVAERMEEISRQTEWLDLFHYQGEFLTRQSFAEENRWGRRINGHRGELHRLVYEFVKTRKEEVEVRLGVRVVEYFESDGDEKKGPHAGVVIKGPDGKMEKVMGDAVLAAEGVRSRGRKLVLGLEEEDEQPKSSGYAVFTHIDDGNIEESWQFPGKPEEALAYLEGWCSVVRELVKATPPGRLIDYKLVYREPLPTFVSSKGRVALIGDAAHPFLPTSIQGASQSIEDGTVIATCLELACQSNKRWDMSKEQVVPTALKAYEKLRYKRVHKAQAMGPKTRERWHKADWNGPEGVWKVPEKLWLLREEWLLGFDAEGDT